MIEIEVNLVGMGYKAAEIETVRREVNETETLLGLWRCLKAEAKPDSYITKLDTETVLALRNGKPCHGEENLGSSVLSAGDKVTFVRPVFGG